jgi:hypothetical protein
MRGPGISRRALLTCTNGFEERIRDQKIMEASLTREERERFGSRLDHNPW